MDISGLKAVPPVALGAPSMTDKTPKSATGAIATAAVSPVVQTPASSAPVQSPAVITAELQRVLQSSPHTAGTTVQFSIDAKTGLPVVTVRDAQSGHIVRQLPVEVAARLLQNFNMGTGTLLDSQG